MEINPEYSLEGHAKAPISLLPGVKSQFIEKDPDSGKDWEQEKGVTEDEIVGWHPRLNGHFAQTPWDSEGQGSLVSYIPWGCRELNATSPEQQHTSTRPISDLIINQPQKLEGLI